MVSKLKASPKLDQQKVVMVEVFSKSFASTSLKRTLLSSKISRKITKFAMKQSSVSLKNLKLTLRNSSRASTSINKNLKIIGKELLWTPMLKILR